MPKMQPEDWDHIVHFEPWEFEPHSDKIDRLLVADLDMIRSYSGIPIWIFSAVRLDDDTSEHYYGWAVDIVDDLKSDGITSRWRWHVLGATMHLATKGLIEINRIGVYDRHLHLGIGGNRDLDRWPTEVLWVGESQ